MCDCFFYFCFSALHVRAFDNINSSGYFQKTTLKDQDLSTRLAEYGVKIERVSHMLRYGRYLPGLTISEKRRVANNRVTHKLIGE